MKADVEKLLKQGEVSNIVELALLRNEITGIYYENVDTKTLKSYQKENLTRLYDAYIALNGNSYVKSLMRDEMSHWKVEP